MTHPDTIKDALKACTTPEEVERVAAKYKAKVVAWRRGETGYLKEMSYQIINLKAYQLKWME